MDPQHITPGGWNRENHDCGAIRAPKGVQTNADPVASILCPTARPFVPKGVQAHPEQPGSYQNTAGPSQQHFSQPQMDVHPSQSASMVQHRFAAAQGGGVEPGGGGGGGGGGDGYDYQPQMGHGAMANGGGSDAAKVSALQNRMNNVRISGGGGGGMSRGDNNGKDFNHHPHHQQPLQQHHLHQNRVQQQAYQQQQQQQQHHGHNHHGQQGHGQQMHQPYAPYAMSFSTAINNQLNHPMLGSANHMGGGGGGGMGDNRKHNGGGGGGGGFHQNYRVRQQHHYQQQQQQHHPHHQHHHHHQQQQQQQQQQHHHHQGSHHHHGGNGGGGGAGGGGGGHGMMASGGGGGGGMVPMPGGGGGNTNAGGDYNDDEQASDIQSFALDYLTEVIAELFDNPGMFEVVKEKVTNMFGDFHNEHYVMSNAVEMLFEQSIKETNFRYMGARLCHLLDSLDDRPDSLMRQLLKLKMEDQQHDLPNYMNQEQVKVRGTTLFLAELYMQLRSPHHKLGQEIARHIIDAIRNLFSREGPENLKCVCQCLKLCGFELEQDLREEVHSILSKLETVQAQTQTGNLIKSVLDLHSKSWGRSEITAVPVAQPVLVMQNTVGGGMQVCAAGGKLNINDSPVFYGPDGKVLTEEENSFLETNIPSNQDPAFSGYDDDDEEYEGIDPEHCTAFDDFMQSKNASN